MLHSLFYTAGYVLSFLLSYPSSSFPQGVKVSNLSEVKIKTVDDVQRVLEIGAQNRVVDAHKLNAQSSRSHAVLQIQVLHLLGSIWCFFNRGWCFGACFHVIGRMF